MLAACCMCVVCLNTSPVGSEARSVVLALASDALPKGGTLSPSSPASTGVRLPPTTSCQPHGGRHYKARFGCYLIAHKSSVCNARSYPEVPAFASGKLTVFVRDGGTGIQWSKKWAYSPHTQSSQRDVLLQIGYQPSPYRRTLQMAASAI